MQAKLLSTLKEAYSRYQKIGEETTVKKLQVKVNGQTRNIDYTDIYFFEASPNFHKIILHLKNEQIEFYGRLKEYEELSEEFYRCHKSYIVNKQYVESIDIKTRLITMINGEVCYASSRLIKGLIE
jgi:two-component system response regulator AgrA